MLSMDLQLIDDRLTHVFMTYHRSAPLLVFKNHRITNVARLMRGVFRNDIKGPCARVDQPQRRLKESVLES